MRAVICLLFFSVVVLANPQSNCGTGCVNNYTYFITPSTTWPTWPARDTQFCGRAAVDWLNQSAVAQAANQAIDVYIVANYLTTTLNIQAGACASPSVKVACNQVKTNYMIPAQDPSNSVCTGGADSFNSLLLSQRPYYKPTFYEYITGADGGPVLCSPPPI